MGERLTSCFTLTTICPLLLYTLIWWVVIKFETCILDDVHHYTTLPKSGRIPASQAAGLTIQVDGHCGGIITIEGMKFG